MSSQAKKFDQGKPDLSLIPYIAQVEEAFAWMVGEGKYGRYNYCLGLPASKEVAAIQRHIGLWFNGEERCPVDGQHHLGAARAGLGMILRQMELGTLTDDRFKKSEGSNIFLPAIDAEQDDR